ncbi:hypothetical protein [Nocardioides sp. zg-1228]|uniref:hypothetical protein n=1 Tax=Nocardioides sp. zg-1228 TaxID=2763008 RepID=UPI0016430361|nr:hypothetical protein [Nocardioides sp. zg-1228]MBC2932291.1 hypothetical protein [Nocardioides sp. zg-1228]QSF57812.1 hypothetical protein JX575_00800 [Nocardioides sp. zg-1228]
MTDQLPPGPWLRPVRPPADPVRASAAQRELMDEIHEQVLRKLERARELDAAAKEQMLTPGSGASGEALDGAVQVRVDSRGMIQSVSFEPGITGLSADELREETLAALQQAKAGLGLGSRSAGRAVDALFDRSVAQALLRFLDPQETP